MGIGTREILVLFGVIFLLVLTIITILTPFFVLGIRNELISINRKITQYMEKNNYLT